MITNPLITALVAASSLTTPGHSSDQEPHNATAEASIEGGSYRPLEPIWVTIEAKNESESPWKVRGNVHPYDYIRVDISKDGETVGETSYRKYVRSLRYNVGDDGFFSDTEIIGWEDYQGDFVGNSRAIEPGETYTIRFLANLARDMTAPGRYSMRFGIPYFHTDEGGGHRIGIAWTEVVVVEVTGLPVPPGNP